MSASNMTRRCSAARRPGRTDWQRVDRQTDADIRAAAARDPDVAPLAAGDWFRKARLEEPQPGDRKRPSDAVARR